MRIPLHECRLYGILDLGYVAPAEVERVARAMIRGGVDLVQLRAKNLAVNEVVRLARKLHPVTQECGVPLVVNDHPEVARDVAVEGIHLGQDDLAIAEARKIAPDCFIGRSTHSLEQATRAIDEGADYIGFGPLFATPTKPDYPAIGVDEITAVHHLVARPIFCIGGIKLENLPAVLAAGARRVVIVSGLLHAADIAEYARSAKQLLSAPIA